MVKTLIFGEKHRILLTWTIQVFFHFVNFKIKLTTKIYIKTFFSNYIRNICMHYIGLRLKVVCHIKKIFSLRVFATMLAYDLSQNKNKRKTKNNK